MEYVCLADSAFFIFTKSVLNTRFLSSCGVSVQIKNFWSRFFACSFCVSVADCISVLLTSSQPIYRAYCRAIYLRFAGAGIFRKNHVALTPIPSNAKCTFPFFLKGSEVLNPEQGSLGIHIRYLLRHCRIAQNKFMGRILIYVKSLFSNPF